MTLIHRYLELGLRIGRHIDGFVDAYYGPPGIAERVDAEPPAEPADLAATARELLDELDGAGLGEQRTRALRGQLVALETVARRLGGEEMGYADEVERCYGVRPEWTPETVFEAAHAALDEALPGDAPLPERFERWKDALNVPGDALADVLCALARDCRARTVAMMGLPEGEDVDIELVSGKPWEAFNYYLGGLRSHVVVNTDLPVRATLALTLVTHECYPGHHTERATKEAVLVRGQGCDEETIVLIGTPQSIVSEGIAEVAGELLLGDEEEELAAAHLQPLGIPYEPELAAAVKRGADELRAVGTNSALLLHERGASLDEVREYLMRWGLVSPERAAKSLEFMVDPMWRTYVACYSEGRRLARRFVGGDVERFRRLLTEQLVPADLGA
jgi:hypothetical protein